jgi:hypothetical protein
MVAARYSRDDWQDGDMCLGSSIVAAIYRRDDWQDGTMCLVCRWWRPDTVEMTGKMATCA